MFDVHMESFNLSRQRTTSEDDVFLFAFHKTRRWLEKVRGVKSQESLLKKGVARGGGGGVVVAA